MRLQNRWNGSSWSEQNDLNTGIAFGGNSGTYTAALIYTGQSDSSGTEPSATEQWTTPTTSTVTFTTS